MLKYRLKNIQSMTKKLMNKRLIEKIAQLKSHLGL